MKKYIHTETVTLFHTIR